MTFGLPNFWGRKPQADPWPTEPQPRRRDPDRDEADRREIEASIKSWREKAWKIRGEIEELEKDSMPRLDLIGEKQKDLKLVLRNLRDFGIEPWAAGAEKTPIPPVDQTAEQIRFSGDDPEMMQKIHESILTLGTPEQPPTPKDMGLPPPQSKATGREVKKAAQPAPNPVIERENARVQAIDILNKMIKEEFSHKVISPAVREACVLEIMEELLEKKGAKL